MFGDKTKISHRGIYDNQKTYENTLEAIKAAINQDLSATISNLIWIIGYTIIFMIISTLLFKKKMK